MASDSTVSSRVSLISLDPAVASHITATTVPSTSQHGSSPRKSTKTPDTEVTRRHMRNNSAPNTLDKKRSNSLRRVKNSTEILRQRSTKSARKQRQQDSTPDTRGGRNFTVGNVGTGGILYLTPSAFQGHGQHSINLASPAAVTTPVTAPALLGQDHLQTSLQTVSDSSSQARSTSPKRSLRSSKRRVAVSSHGRSQSFSTVEEHRHSLSAAAQSRTLRIVINRPDTARPKTAKESIEEVNEELSPTLEVPIPHYRIGTFRFSNQGTPVLRNSSFTRASATPSEVTPTATTTRLDHYLQGPPPSSLKAFARLGAMHLGVDDDPESSNLPVPSSFDSETNSDSTNSVQPAAFDQLTRIYDDPSVVRYCQNVREITAATPARIIAQISSDSFMDYELVSDFFLTFRSYMSTYTVLDLLLARLRWAIGRLEDDGRIIRVRTFAALRHWVLNYFMDDFFVDIRLRERFCAEVNKLYADVKASPENGYSDLKLLRDLKRCWNGRCSLCWDPEGFELDGDQEEDILPGGPIDIQSTPRPRTRTAVRPNHPPAEIPRPDILRGPSHSWFELDKATEAYHDRQQSSNSDQIPPSLGSDGSLQANSCFPPKAFLRPSAENNVNAKGPHPVSVQHRRKNAPANLQVNTHSGIGTKSAGHKRGASSIDSNRQSTPRKPEEEQEAIVGEEGNIIRGLLYSPSAPFVQIVSTNSTQSLDRNEVGGMREGPRRAHGTQSATQPTGRNIFGSLRKVLGNRHGQVDVTLLTASHSAQDVPIRSQKPTMPLNLSKSHDELRNQPQLTISRKGEVRIDLLCAAVCQNYESKFPSKHRITYGAFFASNPPIAPVDNTEDELVSPRLNNRATAQSGSILIVDDTRPDLPSMSGALRPNTDDMIGINPESDSNALFEGEAILPMARSDSIDAVATQRSSDVLGTVMNVPSADGSNDTLERLAAGPSFSIDQLQVANGSSEERVKTPTTVSSRTVRADNTSLDLPRPTDESASIVKAIPSDDTQDAAAEGDGESGPDAQDKPPAHALRRRPGGDLRRVENVQDLDHSTHHDSFDTVSAASDSPHESLLIMRTDTGRTIKRDPEAPRKAVSMINTHSSQHLRPSFEAAVAEFSAIPDDDDGGLEATLMKLEGRYEKKSPPMEQHPLDTTGKRRSLPDLKASSHIDLRDPVRRTRQSLDIQVREITNDLTSHASLDGLRHTGNATILGMKGTSSRRSSIFGLPTESIAGSEESDRSLPLLKRDAAHESTTGLAPAVQGPVVAPGYFAQDPPQLFHLPKGPPPSGNKNAHMHNLSRPDTADDSARSFLLDEDENLSDLSSEISVDIINYSDVVDNSMAPMLAAPGTAISGLEIPAHPLTYASVVNLNALEQSARTSDPIPNEINPARPQAEMHAPAPPRSWEKPLSQPLARLPAGPAHLPFVLACDSQVLAQQMTLVEKSALSEVEWSDLVEMRWDSKAAEVLDWVDCLTQTKVRGIDLVITRFNLVVKWAMSEIILTQDIHERARVITKYIHVAAHARRLHNYATMLQLTIALTSTDCTRLTKTWALVSAPDMSLLKHMEALVQPIRNFHDLRLEMESADLSDGCIPFIGLYVHDLTYNAQKPSRIPGGPGRESLINFERYRTCAIIVKGLLRFIDAGSRYSFEPIEGIIERCLWLAALPDDRIRSTSKSLEY